MDVDIRKPKIQQEYGIRRNAPLRIESSTSANEIGRRIVWLQWKWCSIL